MEKVVGFGEIMLRLSPPGQLRFVQASGFEANYGGAESNVIASLAQWGVPTEFVTRLPAHDLGEACLRALRQYGIETQHIVRGGERIGIYFLEIGASGRGSQVIYDRDNSSLATVQPGMIDWQAVFTGASWFHWTGITPALSQGAYETLIEALRAAKRHELKISCDLNYRAKLWQWGKNAADVMPELIAYADYAIGNEEDAERVFGISAPQTDLTLGEIDPEKYGDVCQELTARFPNLQKVAITLRGSLSASHNTWNGILWDKSQIWVGSRYNIEPVVDRVGTGDSFSAGLIYGLLTWPEENEKILRFALAASSLKHTIWGDFNQVGLPEIQKLMEGDASGRITR